MKQTAIYARVSTTDQQPRTQLRELRAYAKRRELRVVHEFVDRESGAKVSRPHLNQLMELARKRQLDVVLVWKFDRFARSSQQLINALEEFRELGVDFISYTESIDTTTPSGKAFFTVISAFAEFERSLIRERVVAGLNRARAEGTKLGRPAVTGEQVNVIRKMRRSRLSIRTIASATGLSRSVVGKYSTGMKRTR